ncbi:MAG TPA: biotin transporter BioY [Geminicoccaceae bacterium]|nr:biotin transporter BioY [Geminicoccaceae bacterium]
MVRSSAAAAASLTLADALWPAAGASRALRAALLALLGTALLTLSAKVQVPFYPVPMTLQTGVVVLIGIAYGTRLGVATVLLYLAEGAAGLPVFAGTPEKGLGLAYMLGPTGGYLLGFALAAAIAGYAAERCRRWPALALAVALALAAVFVPGVGWLAAFVGTEQALTLGLLPFVWGELLKGALAVALGAGAVAVARRAEP